MNKKAFAEMILFWIAIIIITSYLAVISHLAVAYNPLWFVLGMGIPGVIISSFFIYKYFKDSNE